jgi:putative phosphoribosyl transferase
VVPFRNRRDAGRQLAAALASYANDKPLILGLPRGGVPVAAELARALDAPLDVWAVRKLGAPGRPELGMGAIAEGGGSDVDPTTLRLLDVSPETLDAIVARERLELDRRSTLFRSGRPLPDVRGRTVILVDDGVATGGTARAAIRAIRAQDPARLVLAVPVASPDALAALEPEVDEILCLFTPPDFRAVGAWYEDFSQTTDDEVVDLLRQAAEGSTSKDDLLVDGLGREVLG